MHRETRPAGRRGIRILLALVALLPLVAVGLYAWQVHRAGVQLREAFAEAERLDGPWRLTDLEARREVFPDEQNLALQVIAANALIPTPWPVWFREEVWRAQEPDLGAGQEFEAGLWQPPPPVRLQEAQARVLRGELARAEAAVAAARLLVRLRRGRYPIAWSEDYISTLLPNVQEARQVASLLGYDASLLAHDGKSDEAVQSCRAAFLVSCSLNDLPLIIGQLVRIACRAVAINRLERVLAQGEGSAEVLRTFQALLGEEADENLLLIGLRGERAGMDLCLECLEDGRLGVQTLTGLAASPGSGPGKWGGPFDETWFLYLPGAVRAQRAAVLRDMNQLVEIAKQPTFRQRELLEASQKDLRGKPLLARLLTPACTKAAEAGLRSQAELRCAAVALAVERYRLKYQKWPGSLTDLAPEFLREVPLDPFDGQPLRCRKEPQGVAVYSVGKDGLDDGGSFEKLNDYAAPRYDQGFRLWDVARRRQPARPPVPRKQDNGE